MSVFCIGPKSRIRRRSEKQLRKRLERIFDKLWDEADRVIREHTPCKVTVNQHGVSCLNCRAEKLNIWRANKNSLCCGGCKFHTSKGCVANKPLTCRTWLCYTAQKANPEAFRKLERIAERVESMGFYVGRGDKEDSINNALRYLGIKGIAFKWFPTLAKG